MTTQLENKRGELEQWLIDNPTHMNAPEVRHNLQLLLKEITVASRTFERDTFDISRTFERDTFDISDVEIFEKK